MNRSSLAVCSVILAAALAPAASAADPVVSQSVFVTPDTTLAQGMAHVAIDGTTMLVGYNLDDEAGPDVGAVYVVERQVNGTWVQSGKILPVDPNPAYHFGERVALQGDTAVVGDPSGFQGGGGVYTYQRIAGAWTQTQVINPPWVYPGGLKGIVALSGDDLIIGAPNLYNGFSFTGGVFFYKRTAGVWTLAKGPVFPSDGSSDGREVAIDGDVAATSFGLAGRVYIYERPAGTWTEVQKLAPANGPSDMFGEVVGISGEWLAVGAPHDDQAAQDAGAVRMFRRLALGQWVEQQKLVAADAGGGDFFGGALALRGSKLVVGAQFDSIGTHSNAGSAYVFELQPNGTWSQTAKLQHPAPATDDDTGQNMALASDGAIAVTSPFHAQTAYGSVLLADCQPLSGDTSTISLSSGGAQVLDVQAGLANAGRTYMVAGSVTGTSPGTPLPGGSMLPLNYDAYTAFTLAQPNNGVLLNSLGVLGAGGGAQAAFALPAGTDSALVGLQLWHAFVVLGTNPKVKLASNPVAVSLVP